MVPMFATTGGWFPCVQNEGLIVHNADFFSIIVAIFIIFFQKNIRPTYNRELKNHDDGLVDDDRK